MVDVIGLEGAGEAGLQLALGLRGVEFGAADPDPRAAARGLGTDIGRDFAIGRQGKPDQLVTRRGAARDDTGALRRLLGANGLG